MNTTPTKSSYYVHSDGYIEVTLPPRMFTFAMDNKWRWAMLELTVPEGKLVECYFNVSKKKPDLKDPDWEEEF
jgi:hypothetical protein